MVRPEDDTAFVKARETDLWNALIVACETANKKVQGLIAVLTSAITHYAPPNTPSENVDYLIESAARGIVQDDPIGLRIILKTVLLKS
jgi:hypothetical protein